MIGFVIAGTVMLACTIFIVAVAAMAPEGWQDDTGFHSGKKKED